MKRISAAILIIAMVVCLLSINTFAQWTVDEYYFNQLSADEKYIYRIFLQADGKNNTLPLNEFGDVKYEITYDKDLPDTQKGFEDFINNDPLLNAEIAKIDKKMENAVFAALMDHPEYYWISNENISQLSLSFSATSRRSIKFSVELVVMVPSNISVKTELSRLDAELSKVKASGTEVQKLEKIHQYLCDKVTYVSTANAHNLYGSLFEGKAVCQGYAEAFKVLCDYYGIKCVCVEGVSYNTEGKAELHMWNYVCLNNSWYAVDVTWDDQQDATFKDFFLVGADTPAVHFDNETFSQSHIPDGFFGGEGSKEFKYPTLSKKAYDFGPSVTPTAKPNNNATPAQKTAIPTLKPGVESTTTAVVPTLTPDAVQNTEAAPEATQGATDGADVENNTDAATDFNTATATSTAAAVNTDAPSGDSADESSSMLVPIIIGAVALGAVIAITVIIISKKKR